MPYLFCERCGGYYELQEGESPEDFDTCQCGGRLRVKGSINGNSGKEETHISNLLSNKIALVAGIIILIILVVFVVDHFTPSAERMDQMMPNTVGAYKVPDSVEKMRSLSDSTMEPVVYREKEYYGKKYLSVDKYYFRSDTPICTLVTMIYDGDANPEHWDSVGNLEGFQFASSRMINDKEVKFLQSGSNEYRAYFHADKYCVDIMVMSAYRNSIIPAGTLQNELFNFTEIFIQEFDKSNVYS